VLRRRSRPIPSTTRPPWRGHLRTAVAVVAKPYLSRQAARPRGIVGRLMARSWLTETAAVNDIAVELLRPALGEWICEIGFGPGRTLSLLANAGAEVFGVEVSPAMMSAAARRNTEPVATGTMRLYQGDGTTLPVADDSLDAVIGVHTIYFWAEPAATLTDIARVLRPGGRLVLAFQAGEHPVPTQFDPDIYHLPTTAEATEWLQAAGFADIGVERRPHVVATVVWVTATAT
jgi:arsenite methyltransferase